MHVVLLEKDDFHCYARLPEGNMQSSTVKIRKQNTWKITSVEKKTAL